MTNDVDTSIQKSVFRDTCLARAVERATLDSELGVRAPCWVQKWVQKKTGKQRALVSITACHTCLLAEILIWHSWNWEKTNDDNNAITPNVRDSVLIYLDSRSDGLHCSRIHFSTYLNTCTRTLRSAHSKSHLPLLKEHLQNSHC